MPDLPKGEDSQTPDLAKARVLYSEALPLFTWSVEISKGLELEFSREPKGEKQPKEPTEEERRKHELTHLPK